MKKGTYVTRAAYQKLAEENKKLVYDISVLVSEGWDLMPDRIFLTLHWRKKFQEQKLLINILKDYLKTKSNGSHKSK